MYPKCFAASKLSAERWPPPCWTWQEYRASSRADQPINPGLRLENASPQIAGHGFERVRLCLHDSSAGPPSLTTVAQGPAANWCRRFGQTRIGTSQEEPTGDGLGATLGTDRSGESSRLDRLPTHARLLAVATRPAFLLQRACPFSCLHLRVESRNGASSASPRENLDAPASSHSRFPTARRTTGARSNPRDRPSLREGAERLPCRCRLLRIPNLLSGNP